MKPSIVASLREIAVSLPDTEEGIACEGTVLEKRTIKVRKKAFVFLGRSNVMLKLGDSLADATAIANEKPDFLKAGASGWVTVKLDGKAAVPRRKLEAWIKESYRLFAGESSKGKEKAKSSKKVGQ